MVIARLVGEQIDQYRISSHISRGGMADVYLAHDEDLDRNVAFKVMLDTLAYDEQYVSRFQREARTVARLDHPNIVQVYSTGKTPLGQPYIAMQFIEGGSLQEKIAELSERDKLLTTEQVLNIMRQLVIALSVAHKANVVHRDLKPANILIRPDGAPILVDLGIAAVQSGPKLTHTGNFVGTPAYMSPEQIQGQPLDGRSDLYSLGIIFYELFAGVRPFDADELTALMFKQVHEEAVPLHRLRPDLKPPTLAIVETLLKKEPEQRFQTAEALVAAIDRAILAEGSHGPNPLATQVLTRLDDSALINRGSIMLSVPIFPQSKLTASMSPLTKGVPLWALITLLVLVSALVVFIFLSPYEGSVPTTATVGSVLPTRIISEAEVTEEIAVVVPNETSTPFTLTDIPSPTATTTPTATLTGLLTTIASPIPTPQPTSTPQPRLLSPQAITASDYDHSGSQDSDGNPTNFLPENAIDRVPSTAWRVPGNGAGAWLEIGFSNPVIISRVGLIPGYAKIDPFDNTDRFSQNYVVQEVRLEFSDDSQIIGSFIYAADMQYIEINRVVTTNLRIVIIDTYEPGGNDPREFTPISEVEIWGWVE